MVVQLQREATTFLDLEYSRKFAEFSQNIERCKFVSVHNMKAYVGSRSIAPFFLNLGNRWEKVNSRLCPFIPVERSLVANE
jgi:hypothetical protein